MEKFLKYLNYIKSKVNYEKIVLGIAGLGTVGSGLLELLVNNKETIAKHTGCEFEIKSVCVQNLTKNRLFLPISTQKTSNPLNLTTDKDIDIFVELMGGIELPRQAIHSALENGKAVVTANKALLAEEGNGLFSIAARKNLPLRFEAAVAGGIPIVETLKESLNSNSIQNILGILNGTSNYILSKMTVEKQDFASALLQAQEKGYAEAEPSLDIDGFDAAHKLNLLIRLAWGMEYPYKKLLIEGIRNIHSMDIEFARELGYRIKHLGHASSIEGKIEAGLFPALVNEDLLLAKVDGAYNAIQINGNAIGSLFLHGLGAGALPTASAVLSDILAIAKGTDTNNFGYIADELPKANLIPSVTSVYPYYLRCMVHDSVGILRDISAAFAEQNVSFAQVIQKARTENGAVPIVFITHKASYQSILNALPKIKPLLVDQAVCFRIFN